MMWDDYGNGWGMHSWMWGSWLTAGLVVVLLAVLASAVVLLLVRGSSVSPPPPTPPAESEALRILRRRFAAGEIDEDEFSRREDFLTRHSV